MSKLTKAEVRAELLDALRQWPGNAAEEKDLQQAVRIRNQPRVLEAGVWRAVCMESVQAGDVVRLENGRLALPSARQ